MRLYRREPVHSLSSFRLSCMISRTQLQYLPFDLGLFDFNIDIKTLDHRFRRVYSSYGRRTGQQVADYAPSFHSHDISEAAYH